MNRYWIRLVLGAGLVAATLLAPALGPQWAAGHPSGSALAAEQEGAKAAFEAAKELGTLEAWNAFLACFPAGFYADLARAYVKKLEEQPGTQGAPAKAAEDGTPSWCASPGNATERAICDSAELSRLDSTLNVAYKRAKFDSPKSVDEINHEQRRWLSRRNLCGDDAACIGKRYDEQIQILESFFAN